jgi:hypothetical protein
VLGGGGHPSEPNRGRHPLIVASIGKPPRSRIALPPPTGYDSDTITALSAQPQPHHQPRGAARDRYLVAQGAVTSMAKTRSLCTPA